MIQVMPGASDEEISKLEKTFEALGISSEVVDEYFTGTVSRIGGITLADIARRTDEAHARAFDPLGLPTDATLPSLGRHKLRSGGETHRYDPEAIHLLQKAVRSGDYALFGQFADRVNARRTACCAGCSRCAPPRRACRWRKSRASDPSYNISRPGRCPTVPSRRRRTRRWPSP